jgi:hypothetical protein
MKRQRQCKCDAGSDNGGRSAVPTAMVNEINRVIAKAMESQTMEIGQYVLDTVFQGNSQRAFSAPRHNLPAGGRTWPPRHRRDRGVQENRIRRTKRP